MVIDMFRCWSATALITLPWWMALCAFKLLLLRVESVLPVSIDIAGPCPSINIYKYLSYNNPTLLLLHL